RLRCDSFPRRVFVRRVRPEPLDNFNPIAVWVGNKETIGPWNRRRFLRGNAVLPKVLSSRRSIDDSQREVPRAERIRPVLLQQMDMLVFELKPQDDEIKRPRFVDFLQAEHVAIKRSAALDVRNEHRTMVDLRDL